MDDKIENIVRVEVVEALPDDTAILIPVPQTRVGLSNLIALACAMGQHEICDGKVCSRAGTFDDCKCVCHVVIILHL